MSDLATRPPRRTARRPLPFHQRRAVCPFSTPPAVVGRIGLIRPVEMADRRHPDACHRGFSSRPFLKGVFAVTPLSGVGVHGREPRREPGGSGRRVRNPVGGCRKVNSYRRRRWAAKGWSGGGREPGPDGSATPVEPLLGCDHHAAVLAAIPDDRIVLIGNRDEVILPDTGRLIAFGAMPPVEFLARNRQMAAAALKPDL